MKATGVPPNGGADAAKAFERWERGVMARERRARQAYDRALAQLRALADNFWFDGRLKALLGEIGRGPSAPYTLPYRLPTGELIRNGDVRRLEEDRWRKRSARRLEHSTDRPTPIGEIERRSRRFDEMRSGTEFSRVVIGARELAQREIPFREMSSDALRSAALKAVGGEKKAREALEALHLTGNSREAFSMLLAAHDRSGDDGGAPRRIAETYELLRGVRHLGTDARCLNAPSDVLACLDAWHLRALRMAQDHQAPGFRRENGERVAGRTHYMRPRLERQLLTYVLPENRFGAAHLSREHLAIVETAWLVPWQIDGDSAGRVAEASDYPKRPPLKGLQQTHRVVQEVTKWLRACRKRLHKLAT